MENENKELKEYILSFDTKDNLLQCALTESFVILDYLGLVIQKKTSVIKGTHIYYLAAKNIIEGIKHTLINDRKHKHTQKVIEECLDQVIKIIELIPMQGSTYKETMDVLALGSIPEKRHIYEFKRYLIFIIAL